jgi:hypothetical protein
VYEEIKAASPAYTYSKGESEVEAGYQIYQFIKDCLVKCDVFGPGLAKRLMEYDVDINEVHQKSTERENEKISQKNSIELELGRMKSKAETSTEEAQYLTLQEKVEIGNATDEIRARFKDNLMTAEQGLKATRDVSKRMEIMNCIAELKATMLEEISSITASIQSEYKEANLTHLKRTIEVKQKLRKTEQMFLELTQKIQNEKRVKARIQAFSTLLGAIMQRVQS